LPDWGFNQHEVVTDKIISQDDTVWNVEEHRYTKSKKKTNFICGGVVRGILEV